MKRMSFGILVFIIVCLAIATFIEPVKSTEFTANFIYHSYWFVGLWIMLTITGLAWLIRKKIYKYPPVFCLHLSFIVMLSGAFFTFTTGTRGYIHLREGASERMFILEDGNSMHPMPFILQLDRFETEYYPGTNAPVNYKSHVKVIEGNKVSEEIISMNNILSVRGFRFYQSSFDEDGDGTILSVNYDRFGIPVTYGGYLLLGISILWILLSPKGNFRKLLRHPLLKSGLCLLLFIVPTGLFANFGTLEKNEAAKLGMLQIMYNNRVAPLQTFAKDFTRKITKKKQYQNYTCEQVIAGWIFYPEKWQNEPMIYVKNKELRALLDIGEYVPLTDFFNEKEEYRLALLHSKILKENKESPLLKAIAETDEKIQIINMLQQGVMLTVFPYENSGKLQWFSPASELPEDIPDNDKLLIRNVFFLLKSNISKGEIDAFRQTIDKLKIYQYKMGGESVLSESKMEAERLYNKLDITTILYRVNLCLGVILFIFFCIGMISPNSKLTSFLPVLFKVFALLLLCSFLLLCVDMGLRIYISGRLPLSNGYETMIFIAWCILFISLLFHRKFRLIVPFGFLLSGFVLLVSSLGQMNPQITPLMPVLKSPWLSIHVSLIMMSYALFAFIMLNGITAIILNFSKKDNKEYIEQLMLISRIFLYPAVFLLGAGIFIGAIWANVSWGRYWAWDPKEVWALITFLVYGMAFHCRSLPFFRKPLFFHIYMVIAFSSLLMTYFGVNYLLGGLHSYK